MAKQRINTGTTTVISDEPCFLDAIIINGGTIGNITLYDDLSAVEDNNFGIITAAFSGLTIPYAIQLDKGLTIVTAANTDITVIYYTPEKR